MTEMQKQAIASLKETLKKSKAFAYRFLIQGKPLQKECTLFYNRTKIYTARLCDIRDFLFEVFDYSPSVVGKWDMIHGLIDQDLLRKSKSPFVVYKHILAEDAENIKTLVRFCKHGAHFQFYPFNEKEEACCDVSEKWHCVIKSGEDIELPNINVVPTLTIAFKQAGILLGKGTQELLKNLVAQWTSFDINLRYRGFDVTFSGND